LRSSFRRKTLFTIKAKVALYSSSFSILFCIKRVAIWTLFYKPFVNNPFLNPILLIFAYIFSNPFFYFNSNLTIDEALYEQARAVSFIEKKSISQIVRESLKEYLAKNKKLNDKANLILEADDEKELLDILKNDQFISDEEFKNKFNL